MKLSDLVVETGQINHSKGWHEGPQPNFGDLMALIMSELAEALEDRRLDKDPRVVEYVKADAPVCASWADDVTARHLIETGYKPCGIMIELADVVIRICDCADRHGYVMPVTTIRELVERGALEQTPAESFGDWVCAITRELLGAWEGSAVARSFNLSVATGLTCRFAHWLGVSGEEFEAAIAIKQAYNRTRPHRHGGKVL